MTTIETNDEEQEDDDGCEGDGCVDPYCEERSSYVVEIERTVKFTVRVHNDEEAQEFAWGLNVFIIDEPSDETVDDWDEGYDDTLILSPQDQARSAEAQRALRRS